MQPTHELTVQERPAISHKRNVSRATIKKAVYFVGGIFLLSITCVFAQKVGDGDATHIVINEKMVDARCCIVRQML